MKKIERESQKPPTPIDTKVEKASVKSRSHVSRGILNPQNKKEFKCMTKER